MKVKNRLSKQSKAEKEHGSSRRPSAFSIASSYFGPTALGDDIDIDRTISPELQTSHIFIHEDGFNPASPTRSPFSLSAVQLTDNTSPTSQPLHPPTLSNGVDLPNLTSPDHSSPLAPAPSLATSAQLTPAISGQDCTNTDSISSSNPNSSSGKTSRRLSSFFRSSSSSFMGRVHDIPSRIFKKDKKDNKDKDESTKKPSPPRSTCKITEDQLSPPDHSKRRPTKVEKATMRRRKSADKYIKRKTKKRLRQFRREMKRRMDETPEGKEARKRMNRTEKMLKVMDNAKEKFWEWLDRRDEKRRKKQVRAYTEMREERKKSVLLVPVDRDYEVLARRGSRRDSIISNNIEYSTHTGGTAVI
ncbi:hypothetical protein AA313_de0201323 [Arthrobotrys entomopaga]|nr:hypothetical protein AA313_de0201323 [Arthrobotrys entomopaga]